MYLEMYSFVFILLGVHWVSWIYRLTCFTKFGKFSTIIFFKYFFWFSLFLFSFWDSDNMYVRPFDIFLQAPEALFFFSSSCSFFLVFFFFLVQIGWFLLIYFQVQWFFLLLSPFCHGAHPVCLGGGFFSSYLESILKFPVGCSSYIVLLCCDFLSSIHFKNICSYWFEHCYNSCYKVLVR